jgi:hypothetical protein
MTTTNSLVSALIVSGIVDKRACVRMMDEEVTAEDVE